MAIQKILVSLVRKSQSCVAPYDGDKHLVSGNPLSYLCHRRCVGHIGHALRESTMWYRFALMMCLSVQCLLGFTSLWLGCAVL